MAVNARHRIALVGAGRVGSAVAALLQRAGHEVVSVASRSPASAARAAALLGAPVVPLDAPDPNADLVLIGAADDAIATVARALAPALSPGTIACHFAGARGLAPLGALGARAAALHPVQACPTIEAGLAHLPGSAWGVTVADDLWDWAKTLIEDDLDGRAVRLAEEQRPAWHAAAVMTANGTAALLAHAEAVLGRLGVADPLGVLGPLAAGAIANARVGGGGGATLTGPVVRGEDDTLRRHRAALTPAEDDAYVAVARLVLAAARAAGRMDDGVAGRIEAALEASA